MGKGALFHLIPREPWNLLAATGMEPGTPNLREVPPFRQNPYLQGIGFTADGFGAHGATAPDWRFCYGAFGENSSGINAETPDAAEIHVAYGDVGAHPPVLPMEDGPYTGSCLLTRKQASISHSLRFRTMIFRGSRSSKPHATTSASPSHRAVAATFSPSISTCPSGKRGYNAVLDLNDLAAASFAFGTLPAAYCTRQSCSRGRAERLAQCSPDDWDTVTNGQPGSHEATPPLRRMRGSYDAGAPYGFVTEGCPRSITSRPACRRRNPRSRH